MQAKNIPFTDLDVEHDAAAHDRERALNPRGTVPTITVDDDVMIGFSPESLENRITRAVRRRLGP
jgi:glutathione S-transferase